MKRYYIEKIRQYIAKDARIMERNFEWAQEQCKKKDAIDEAIVKGAGIKCPKCESLDCDIYGKDKHFNELLICEECQHVWRANELPKEIKNRFELLKKQLKARGEE